MFSDGRGGDGTLTLFLEWFARWNTPDDIQGTQSCWCSLFLLILWSEWTTDADWFVIESSSNIWPSCDESPVISLVIFAQMWNSSDYVQKFNLFSRKRCLRSTWIHPWYKRFCVLPIIRIYISFLFWMSVNNRLAAFSLVSLFTVEKGKAILFTLSLCIGWSGWT